MSDARSALPRRKACSECYRSRRSCDHRRPSCSRCLASQRTCIYSSQVRHRGTDECANDDALANNVSQQGEDLGSGTPDSTSSYQELSALPSTSPAIQPQVESFASFDTINSAIEFPPIDLQVDRLEYETIKYCVKALQEFPALLVRAGTTPFIHRSMLHGQGYPTILYDAFSACASYLAMSESTERVVFNILDIRTNQILQAPQSSSLLENLARIQALTLLQSIRLFNGNIRQRALAEAQDELFEQLILVLQAHLAGLNRDFESSWSGWIIAESVRRTLVTAYMLRGVYSLLKNGYCTLSPLVSQMSFTAQSSLWDARTESDWNRRRRNGKTYFVSCMDFSDIILSGTQNDLDDLGMMMLVTYRGYDSVMAWSQGQQEAVWAWA